MRMMCNADDRPTKPRQPHPASGRSDPTYGATVFDALDGRLSPQDHDDDDDDDDGYEGDPAEREPAGREDGPHEDVIDQEPRPVGSGHNVMERAALSEALDALGCRNGSFDHLSSGEEQRARLLLHYRDRLNLFKPHLVGTPAMIQRLEQLDATAPNFTAVTGLMLRSANLSLLAGTPFRAPPIVMLGAPGIGKTRYARALARALATSCDVINGSTIPDVGSICGYPPVWRGSGAGLIAKYLVASPGSCPLVMIDECEKINDWEESRYPLDKLLSLLERHTASAYLDECLRVPMRADGIIWLLACNTLDDALSAPVRDRVVVVSIPSLQADQQRAVLDVMLAEVAGEIGLPVSLAGPHVLEPLLAIGLRRARLAIEIAIGRAVAQHRRFLVAADIQHALTLLAGPPDRAPIGFVRLRDDQP